jgi:hypothetical protein
MKSKTRSYLAEEGKLTLEERTGFLFEFVIGSMPTKGDLP